MDNFEKYLTNQAAKWRQKESEFAVGAAMAFENALLKYQLEKELEKGKTTK